MLNISGIIGESIVDGEGLRVVIFEQGCSHKCQGCQNPNTHSFKVNTLMSVDEIIDIIKINPLLDGITLSGGDPFFQASKNIELIEQVKKINLDVWAYTGFSWEEFYDFEYSQILQTDRPIITWDMIDMVKLCDVLVDGKFIIEKKSLDSTYRGSTNQRIIDVKASIGKREPIILDY